MEETLKQLVAEFHREKEITVEEANARRQTVDSYIASVTTLISKLNELAEGHRRDIEPLVKDKEAHQKLIETAKYELDIIAKSHAQRVETMDKDITKRTASVAELETKETNLNKVIDGLMREFRDIDEKAGNARGIESSLERSVRNLKQDEGVLIASITAKKEEAAKLDADLEQSKTTYSRLSSDIAILEARAKK